MHIGDFMYIFHSIDDNRFLSLIQMTGTTHWLLFEYILCDKNFIYIN